MKRTITLYGLGILLLAVFAAADILPHLSMVTQLTDQELVVQTGSEHPAKSTEGYERNEYWIDHTTGHLISPAFITNVPAIVPGNTFFLQTVFLPVPTPPPDAARVV